MTIRINGARPLLLSSGKVEYFSAALYLRNPGAEGLAQDSLSIAGERLIGEGMQGDFVPRNEGSIAGNCAKAVERQYFDAHVRPHVGGSREYVVDDRRQTAAALETADALDPADLRRAVEERFTPPRMVSDYVAAHEAAVSAR